MDQKTTESLRQERQHLETAGTRLREISGELDLITASIEGRVLTPEIDKKLQCCTGLQRWVDIYGDGFELLEIEGQRIINAGADKAIKIMEDAWKRAAAAPAPEGGA